jgi:hypothetical protein
MRVWDIPPERLCRNHLLSEHCEVHAIWAILTQGKRGYSNHPETMRWVGRLRALYNRHELLAEEMTRRSYQHRSPLDEQLAIGAEVQDVRLNSEEEQIGILRGKDCDCTVD